MKSASLDFPPPSTSTDEVGANETMFLDEDGDWDSDFDYE